jgi:hypothetical protein
MLLFFAATLAAAQYSIFDPTPALSWVTNGQLAETPYKYNHCVSIWKWSGVFFVAWNANRPPVESKPGQRLLLSSSHDEGLTWSTPRAIAESLCPEGRGQQWQPNFYSSAARLWLWWNQGNCNASSDGAYVSFLDEVGSEWQHVRLLFDGSPQPVVDGQSWRLFASQQGAPGVIVEGARRRVMLPVTMMATNGSSEYRNAVVFTDDDGQTFRLGGGVRFGIPGEESGVSQWEPTVWAAQADGNRTLMIARNNALKHATTSWTGESANRTLLASISDDGGMSWSRAQFLSGLESVQSRMYVWPWEKNGRRLLIDNDWDGERVGNASDGWSIGFDRNRYNVALFLKRIAGASVAVDDEDDDPFAFVPAVGLASDHPLVQYPQSYVDGECIYTVYTRGYTWRGLELSKLCPAAPPATSLAVLPRGNILPSPAPTYDATSTYFTFNGNQYVDGHPGRGGTWAGGQRRFTVGAEMVVRDGGHCILDTRGGGGGDGVVFYVENEWNDATFTFDTFLNVHAYANANTSRRLLVPYGVAVNVSAEVDLDRATVLFRVRRGLSSPAQDYTARLIPNPPATWVPPSGVPRIGASRSPTTQVHPLAAEVRRVNIDGLIFDAATVAAGQFVLPPPPLSRARRVVGASSGASSEVIEVCAEGSASVELPSASRTGERAARAASLSGTVRVNITTVFGMSARNASATTVLLTMGAGDAEAAVRLALLCDGSVILGGEQIGTVTRLARLSSAPAGMATLPFSVTLNGSSVHATLGSHASGVATTPAERAPNRIFLGEGYPSAYYNPARSMQLYRRAPTGCAEFDVGSFRTERLA